MCGQFVIWMRGLDNYYQEDEKEAGAGGDLVLQEDGVSSAVQYACAKGISADICPIHTRFCAHLEGCHMTLLAKFQTI